MLLHATEDDVEVELRHMAGIVILGMAYGLDIRKKDDTHVTAAENAQHVLCDVVIQGAYLVNSIPALKCVPEWMPGATFRRQAREWRAMNQDMAERPFREVKEGMPVGDVPLAPSFVSSALEKGVDDDIVRDAAATMYMAGTDTTVCALLNFTLAMLDHTELQARAQAELDALLPHGQLPGFVDEAQLPFVTAIVWESLRYTPVAPVGIPHAYSGEIPDNYNGYTIPKGSVVIPNIWSMVQDEIVYPDPGTFNAERFLTAEGKFNPDVRNPADIIFGFGRRACPGRNMAYASVWITIASVLRTFNIEKAKGPYGSVIEPTREYMSSLVLIPKHFKCRYVPRSEEAAATIRATEIQQYGC